MKNVFLFISIFFAAAMVAQEPINLTLGGRRNSSVCKGDSDPNTVLGNQFVSYECHTYKDTVSGKVWEYYPLLTPKWRIRPDSAGNYVNSSRPGIIDLGGAGEIQNTYLNMGPVADNRVFRVGEFGVSNPFGLVMSRGANNYGEVELSLIDATKDIYWDVWQRGIESRFRRVVTTPSNSVLRQSLVYPSIYGNLNTVFEHQVDGDFKTNGGFVANVRENNNLTTTIKEQGAEVDLFLYRKAHDGFFPATSWSLRNQDTLSNAGVLIKRQNYLAGHYIPNGAASNSMAYSLVMGKFDFSHSQYEKDLNLGGYNVFHNVPGTGERFAIRQHRHNDFATPSIFEWFSIGEFDGTETGNKVRFYGKYPLPNAAPSPTNGIKQTIVWTGNGTEGVPAFETLSSPKLQQETFIATSGQTVFTAAVAIAAPVGNAIPLVVYKDGSRLGYTSGAVTPGYFSYTGASITVAPCLAGSQIIIDYQN